jgi:GrpB-like predicted nucleotidyltransferase (UPF0157 family)
MITNLGLKKGELTLVPFNSSWKKSFEEEVLRIHQLLPNLQLHHIGSTAIKDIVAKPVLDIMGEVENIIEANILRPQFEELGYVWKGEYGIEGRRYCVLYNETQKISYVHLHIFEKSSTKFKQHLFFRDQLNANETLRNEYEELKKTIVASGIPREKYSEAKAEFIQKVLSNKF